MNSGEAAAGFYPERVAAVDSLGDRAWLAGAFRLHQLFHRRAADPAPFAREVVRHAERLRGQPLERLVPQLRYRLRRATVADALLAECFGFCLSARQCSEAPDAVPAAEVIGAARTLFRGGIVELADLAERRTALVMAAAAMALQGTQVHLLAAGEARVAMLAEVLDETLAKLGVGVGIIREGLDSRARDDAYGELVVCGTLREIGNDYLRDRATLGGRPRRVLGTLDRLSGDVAGQRLHLSGMRCALVDEADEVMLDDARVPLALTAEADRSAERLTYEQALEFARALREPAEFRIGRERAVLTEEGARRLERLTRALGGLWAGRERREELILIALEALHLAHRDRDYEVVQGRVVFPPRPTEESEEPDESRDLLQKLIEVKEGCRLSAGRLVLAQITVPRVLGRYLHLAGTCADARGLEGEFWRLYRLRTVGTGRYPAALPWRARVFATAAAKRAALLDCIRTSDRVALVIAMRSPAEVQALCSACAAAGIKVGLVGGAGDAAAQEALTRLERPGGVIITLYPGERVVKRDPSNSLPVRLVVGDLHDGERRIGQIARAYGAQAYDIVVSLEDETFTAHLGERELAAASRAAGPRGELPSHRARRWVSRATRNAERKLALARAELAAMERGLDDLLAFSGRRE